MAKLSKDPPISTVTSNRSRHFSDLPARMLPKRKSFLRLEAIAVKVISKASLHVPVMPELDSASRDSPMLVLLMKKEIQVPLSHREAHLSSAERSSLRPTLISINENF